MWFLLVAFKFSPWENVKSHRKHPTPDEVGRSPFCFILENVKSLTSKTHVWILKRIKRILEAVGYQVFCEVLNTMEHGIPQSRPRTPPSRESPGHVGPQTAQVPPCIFCSKSLDLHYAPVKADQFSVVSRLQLIPWKDFVTIDGKTNLPIGGCEDRCHQLLHCRNCFDHILEQLDWMHNANFFLCRTNCLSDKQIFLENLR